MVVMAQCPIPECGMLAGPLVNNLLDHIKADHKIKIAWYELQRGAMQLEHGDPFRLEFVEVED